LSFERTKVIYLVETKNPRHHVSGFPALTIKPFSTKKTIMKYYVWVQRYAQKIM